MISQYILEITEQRLRVGHLALETHSWEGRPLGLWFKSAQLTTPIHTLLLGAWSKGVTVSRIFGKVTVLCLHSVPTPKWRAARGQVGERSCPFPPTGFSFSQLMSPCPEAAVTLESNLLFACDLFPPWAVHSLGCDFHRTHSLL